jgi:competence CoiA-like predicted nuclease
MTDLSTPKGQREFLIRRILNLYYLSQNSTENEIREKAESELNAIAAGRNGDLLMYIAQTVLFEGAAYVVNPEITNQPTLDEIVIDKIENQTPPETIEQFTREAQADFEQAIKADLQEGGPQILKIHEANQNATNRKSRLN